ncbi:MAG: EcsC family protein [Candidatus Omnitrophica bacterium]|nr:EcsC family protein [Candidatus Omnitrophota bacterium]
MRSLTLQIPWSLAVLIALLAGFGLITLIRRSAELFRIVFVLRKWSFRQYQKEQQELLRDGLNEADRRAQELLDQTIQKVWYTFSPVEWLNFKAIQIQCQELITRIAAVYYPDSKRPEFEVTLLDLLKLTERIAFNISSLLAEFPTFRKISVQNILEAKALIEQTKKTIDRKGIQTSRRFASRVWAALNLMQPDYWIRRAVFKGVSEVVGRTILTSTYRIVGNEAIQIYRSAIAEKVSPADLVELESEADAPEPEITSEPSAASPEPPAADGAQATTDIKLGQTEPTQESYALALVEESPDSTSGSQSDDPAGSDPMNEDTPSSESTSRGMSITRLLAAFIEGSMTLWEKIVNPEKIIARFRQENPEVQCLSDIRLLDVDLVDSVAEEYIRKGRWLSAAEGAATGFGGIFLLSADAVSLLALQLRTIQQVGYCYGFDVSRPEEKLFAAKLLTEAYQHPAKKERQSLMNEMRTAASLLTGQTPFRLLQKRLFVQGFAKAAQKIGIRMGGRKAAQFVPILGSLAGGTINQKITYDIACIAREVYRERFLQVKNSYFEWKS